MPVTFSLWLAAFVTGAGRSRKTSGAVGDLAYQNARAEFSAAWRLAGASFASPGYLLRGVQGKLCGIMRGDKKRSIYTDCDPGLDDAVAIALPASAPELAIAASDDGRGKYDIGAHDR